MKTVNKTETTCFYFTGISFDNAQELTTQTGNAKKNLRYIAPPNISPLGARTWKLPSNTK